MWNGLAFVVLTTMVAAGTSAAAPSSSHCHPESAERPHAAAGDAAASTLRDLFQSAAELDLREDPISASRLGDGRYDREWPQLTAAAVQRRHRQDRLALEQLLAIDPSLLSETDRLDYDVFAAEYRRRIASERFKTHLYDILTTEGGLIRLAEIADALPFQTVADYEDWTARLRALAPYVDQSIQLLRIAIRERRTHPAPLLKRLASPLEGLASVAPDQHPFHAPFTRIPAHIPASDRERLRAQGREAIERVVLPAYERLQAFYRNEYLPAARSGAGLWDTPEGRAFYRERIAFFTGTTLSPSEIHAIGLREVQRTLAQIAAVIAQAGFVGSYREFVESLRSDARFYYDSAEELFAGYAAIAKSIDPQLTLLFGNLPRAPYGVRAIPADIAANVVAYYKAPSASGARAGYLYVNLHRPEIRPKYEMAALVAHEGVPGHHLQAALALERRERPLFRRNIVFPAYSEGWALYAESLGVDLGIYSDPYSRFGQLSFDLWRAARLVVDTGLHHLRWTREQALDFLRAHAALGEADLQSEVDRYTAIPGQALAYKIGQLRIQELRRRAQAKLGSRFDVREFHDIVLGTGPVPLDVLQSVVERWLEDRLVSASH